MNVVITAVNREDRDIMTDIATTKAEEYNQDVI